MKEVPMIQYISKYTYESKISTMDFSKIASPNSLDQYEVNIIDFSSDSLWRFKGSSCSNIDDIQDFKNLKIIIDRSKKTKFVFIFPQNGKFYYNYSDSLGYFYNSIEIKNNLTYINYILSQCIETEDIKLIYEDNKTKIGDNLLESSFYFELNDRLQFDEVTSSISGKLTSFKLKEHLYSTLNFHNNLDALQQLLINCSFIKQKSKAPLWFNTISRLNDNELHNKREELIKNSEEIQNKIQENEFLIAKNNEYKSILYSNGPELERVVIELVEKIFNNDLSSFVDMKKEDFFFVYENTHFIGEIKGVNTNLKNSHLSQLNTHVEEYLDKNSITEEFVKGILIINTSRKTAPEKREPPHEDQIAKAKNKYGFLVVRTEDLLTIYEKLLDKSLDVNTIIDKFKNQKGLIQI